MRSVEVCCHLVHAGGGVVQAAGALLLLAPLALVGDEAEDGEADAGDDEREAERDGAAGVPQAASRHATLAPEVCHQPGDQLLQSTEDLFTDSILGASKCTFMFDLVVKV